MTAATYNDYSRNISRQSLDNYQSYPVKQYAENKDTELRYRCMFKIVSAKNIAQYGALGAIIGAIISIITGIWNTLWGIRAVQVGAAAGAAYGTYVSFEETEIVIQDSKYFREVKGEFVMEDISEIFQLFLLEDPVLKELICPILGDLPRIPVRAPDGGTYDQERIVHRIRTKPQNVPASVNMFRDFTEEDLIFDNENYLQVSQRINQIINEEIDRVGLQQDKKQIIKDGLVAYIKFRNENNKDLFEQLAESCRIRYQKLKKADLTKDGTDYWSAQKRRDEQCQNEINALASLFESCVIKFNKGVTLDEHLYNGITSLNGKINRCSEKLTKFSEQVKKQL